MNLYPLSFLHCREVFPFWVNVYHYVLRHKTFCKFSKFGTLEDKKDTAIFFAKHQVP